MKRQNGRTEPASTPASSAELEGQLDDLRQRLAAVMDATQRIDAMDVDKATALAAQRLALESAVATAAARLAEAQQAERESAAAARLVELEESRLASLEAVSALTRLAGEALAHVQALLAELAGDVRALHAAGGSHPAATRVLLVQHPVSDALGWLASYAPELVGLPAQPTTREVQRAEAEAALEKFERLLAEAKAQLDMPGRERSIASALHGVRTAQKRLAWLDGKTADLPDWDAALKAATTGARVEKKSWAIIEDLKEQKFQSFLTGDGR